MRKTCPIIFKTRGKGGGCDEWRGGEKNEREAGALMDRSSTGPSIYRDELLDSHEQNGQRASKTPVRVVSRSGLRLTSWNEKS